MKRHVKLFESFIDTPHPGGSPMQVPFSKFLEVAARARRCSISGAQDSFFEFSDNVIRDNYDESYPGNSVEIVVDRTGEVVLFGEAENRTVPFNPATGEFFPLEYDWEKPVRIWFDSIEEMM